MNNTFWWNLWQADLHRFAQEQTAFADLEMLLTQRQRRIKAALKFDLTQGQPLLSRYEASVWHTLSACIVGYVRRVHAGDVHTTETSQPLVRQATNLLSRARVPEDQRLGDTCQRCQGGSSKNDQHANYPHISYGIIWENLVSIQRHFIFGDRFLYVRTSGDVVRRYYMLVTIGSKRVLKTQYRYKWNFFWGILYT